MNSERGDKSEPLSAHDHGNCELCDQIERELAEARTELLAIHEAIMNPQSVVINGSDTFTVAHVKAFIQRVPSSERAPESYKQARAELERSKIHGPDSRTIDELEYVLQRLDAAERDFIQVHHNCVAARQLAAPSANAPQERGFRIERAAMGDIVHYCSTCNSPTTCLERKACSQYKGTSARAEGGSAT